MEDCVQLDVCYGPLVRGEVYRVAARGSDWVLVKADGKAVYVPKDITRRVYGDSVRHDRPERKPFSGHRDTQEEFVQKQTRRRDRSKKQRDTA